KAVAAANERGYWSPFAESPSPRVYGENANEIGLAAFEAYKGKDFPLAQGGETGKVSGEVSPFGPGLDIRYPRVPVDALVLQSQAALDSWREAGPRVWVGVALEILQRLNRHRFEIAHAVQHTTGQGFMVGFQAGGPHAQDRGLEAVAYAWSEMSRIPGEGDREKPQGKQDPIKMKKRFTVVPRGIGLV